MNNVVVSLKHRVMVMPFDARVMAVVPGTKTLPDGRIAVPHTEDTTKLVRNLGYTAPAPVLCYYDWNNDTPFATQKVTAALLSMNERAFVLSEMGTGKTRATLYAIDYLMRAGLVRRALIVAPLSTLSTVWDSEIFAHFQHLSTGVLWGSKAKRIAELAKPKHVYIINHDGVGTILKELSARSDIDCVVIDELAAYRNARATRWKVMNAFLKGRKYAWGLTGSPTPQAPTDAYGQVKLLMPHRVPKYYNEFQRSVMMQVSQFRWVPKKDAKEKVFDVMQPAVRYKREDCVELPPVSFQHRPVALSQEQARVYNELMKKLKIGFQEGTLVAVNEGVLFSKLLQITSGWVYTQNRNIVDLDPAPRLEALREILDEAEGKVIVFVDFIHAAERVFQALAAAGVDAAQVSGKTPAGERDLIFNAFQKAESPRVLVAHPKCMAHGLTLTAANVIVWYTPTSSLETYEQACARITRPGQTRKSLIVHLTGTPVESKLYRRLQQKASTQGALLEMFE